MVDIPFPHTKQITKEDIVEFYKLFCQAYHITPSTFDKDALHNGTFTELKEDGSIRYFPHQSETTVDSTKYLFIALLPNTVRLSGFENNPIHRKTNEKQLELLIREKYYPKEQS